MDDGNNYASDDEMDEDDEAGDEMDVEFGEEDTTGSDHTSTDSDEENAHGDQLNIEAHGSEEGWHDEDDEDEDGMNDDDEDDEAGDGSNDEAEEQEITWQVCPPSHCGVVKYDLKYCPPRMSLGQARVQTSKKVMVTVWMTKTLWKVCRKYISFCHILTQSTIPQQVFL